MTLEEYSLRLTAVRELELQGLKAANASLNNLRDWFVKREGKRVRAIKCIPKTEQNKIIATLETFTPAIRNVYSQFNGHEVDIKTITSTSQSMLYVAIRQLKAAGLIKKVGNRRYIKV
jgi:hypothetical protein